MGSTSRELVYQTLDRRGPARVPRQLWCLPWAEWNYPEELAGIVRDFPDDIRGIGGHVADPPPTSGDAYRIGTYVDDFGCVIRNIHDGLVGEVKDALVRDWDTDSGRVHIPREWLQIDRDAINRDCAGTEQFSMAGVSANPFERLQYVRGPEALYMDLADPPAAMLYFLKELHGFFCDQLSVWAQTDVDSLMIADDWGSQRSLLISPALWREMFKPLYRDYVQIAHSAGKRLFMHSDGHIAAIFPDLVELGVDAVNSQIFCMGVDALRPFAGQITFWGEIDRQHLLPHGTVDDIDRAVRALYEALWSNGGCIAQCEFTAGSRPENVRQVFASWDALSTRVPE